MSNLPRASTPVGARDAPEVAVDYCILAKGHQWRDTRCPGDQGPRFARDPGAPSVAQRALARRVDQAVASIRRLGHH
eukprot:9555043-Alexandrium_andersonii.AAC.1